MIRILIKLIFPIIFCILCFGNAQAQFYFPDVTARLSITKDSASGLCGLLREDGSVAVAPIYLEINLISKHEGDPKATYLIRTSQGAGVLDSAGKLVIPPVFEALIPLPYAPGEIYNTVFHTIFLYLENGKYGVLSADGTRITEAHFDFQKKEYHPQTRSYYLTKEHQLYILNITTPTPSCKKVPLLFRSDSLYVFMLYPQPVVYYTTKLEPGKMQPTPQVHFRDGKYIYLQSQETLRIFNRRGKEVGGNNLLYTEPLFEEEAPENISLIHCRQHKMGVLDTKKYKWIVDTIYTDIKVQYAKNRIWAKLPQGWLLFDLSGKQQSKIVYDTWDSLDTIQPTEQGKTGALEPERQILPVYKEILNNFYLMTASGKYPGIPYRRHWLLENT